MDELKNKAFILQLTDKVTAAFIERCYTDGTTPAEVLEGFINDLVHGSYTRGSDERMYAGQYYKRCGYGFFFPGEYRTFTQWLLSYREMENVADSLNDIEALETGIAYFTEHPDECEEGELEELEAELKGSKEDIERYYQEYTERTTKPDSLEEGIKGVREYMKAMAHGKEGVI